MLTAMLTPKLKNKLPEIAAAGKTFRQPFFFLYARHAH